MRLRAQRPRPIPPPPALPSRLPDKSPWWRWPTAPPTPEMPRTAGSSSPRRRWRSHTLGSAGPCDPELPGVAGWHPPSQDVGELLDVSAGDDQLSAFVLLAQPVDELSPED